MFLNKKGYFMNIVLLPVLIMSLLLSTAMLLVNLTPTLAARVTMTVYQQSDGKTFVNETSIDVFTDRILAGEHLLAPNTEGSYTFAVYNGASPSDKLLPYTLSLTPDNLKNIPLVFSLQKNGAYIYGGPLNTDMLSLPVVSLPETDLAGGGTDIFVLKWRWDTKDDESDTALGPRAANGEDLKYSLIIKAVGTVDDAYRSGANGGGSSVRDQDIPKPIADEPGMSEPSYREPSVPEFIELDQTQTDAARLPNTGGDSNIVRWIVIFCAALATMLFLIIDEKRRKKDEENSGNPNEDL